MEPARDRQGHALFGPDGAPVLEPKWERAKLDVSFCDADGRLTHVDVSFTSAATTNAAELGRRAGKPGRAGAQREGDKRLRYRASANPAEPLVAFVVESRGRMGDAAVQLLRAMAPTDDTRGTELSRAYREIGVITARRRAQLLRSAQGGPAGIAARGARTAGR